MPCRRPVETVSLSMSCEVHSTTASLTCQKECDVGTFACFSGAQAALFVFTATATRAWVITSHFRPGLSLRGLEHLHQTFGWLPGTPQGGQLGDIWTAVGEEVFIAGTQIVEPCFPVWGLNDAIFRASPVTHGTHLAFPTIPG